MIHNIFSNLDPDEVSDLLLETYRKWINFALGKESIGGRMLKHPSGRYAASITAEKDVQGRLIAIYIDPASEGAVEAGILEHGHGPIDLKRTMLANAKVSKDGHRYRRINLRQNPDSPLIALANISNKVGGGFVARGPQRSLRSFSKNLGMIWSESYHTAYTDNGWRTMTDAKPSSFIIPAMPAYAPARILKYSLYRYGERVRVP